VGEADSLSLESGISGEVIASIHHVIAVRAHALRAVNIGVLGITNATTGLVLVPAVVGEALGLLEELFVAVVELNSSICKVLEVLASAVAGTVIGAHGALASLALVAVEALALGSLAVANASTGALSISVTKTILKRSINPSKLKGANTIRAITSVMSHTHAPVIIAQALAALANTVTTASVIAGGAGRSQKTKNKC
jgi:hypothetical protein